jgi:hypothetical protein
MNFKDKNNWGSALVNFAFWGFLAGAAYQLIFGGINAALAQAQAKGAPFSYAFSAISNIPALRAIGIGVASYVGPEMFYWNSLGQLFILASFLLVGYGLLRVSGQRKPLMIFGGLIAAVLNIIPVLHAFPAPFPNLLSILATGGLFVGLVGWVFTMVERPVDAATQNLLSGWGPILVVLVMGGLFDMKTMIGGYTSFDWAMVFSGCLGFLMMIGGLIVDETGPAGKKATKKGPVEAH